MRETEQRELSLILLDALDLGVVVLGADQRVIAWNAWLTSAAGIPREAAIGNRLQELFISTPEIRLLASAAAASVEFGTSRLFSHTLHPALFPLRTRAGHSLIHDVTIRAIGAAPNRFCLVQVSDVTVSANREGILRERQNARYDAVVDSAPDVILTLDDEDIIQLANPAAAAQFGFTATELVGRPAAILFEDQASWNETRRAVLNGDPVHQPVEVVARRKDGSATYLEVSISRWMSQSRVLITAILRDVNERRAAQEALRASESQFRTLALAMPNHVWTSLPNGQLDWFNDRVYEYSGTSPGALDGHAWSDLVHVEDVAGAVERWNSALSSGAPYEAEFRLRRSDGIFRWHIARAFPIRGAHGEILRWVGSNTDIEDQKTAAQALADINVVLEQRVSERTSQLLQAEEALRQSQKMEAVGQLTGGIAHDFNNLLQGIMGALNIIKKRVSEGRISEVDRFVGAALDSADRAATLTQRLLAFSRRQPIDPRPIDIGHLIGTVEELLRRSIGESINMKISIGHDLWLVRCDGNQLENALLNLAINARDAMPDGGTMTIEVANQVFDASEARARELGAGEFVRLRVRDTGVGMPPDVRARAFDPFYTTKPIGKGTGLGLSMIYGFIRQSDGAIGIESEPDKGTTIDICLPRYKGDVIDLPIEDQPSLDRRTGTGEVVLVVEDQDVVRLLIVEVLNDLGYRALETSDSAAALRILQSSQRVDLLVSDIGLPGLNGRQLADAARIRRPALKVLFVTGYAENAAGGSFLEAGMEIIIKPFAIDVLADKIRAMIQTGPRQMG
jgi:PAS domain S-box-containing protein